ncbi:MAG: chemotaxis protein CheA [Nitrospiraceae bacterium]|nr:chemotaxis protein CheA [Nitrospiraceae bacterium]
MPDDMEEIIADFVAEAEETLDRIDPLFIELEEKGFDQGIINEIFRGMHTMKGAAGFLGFQKIVDVSHRAETILKKLRDKEIDLEPGLVDVILKSFDMVRLLIGHIKAKDQADTDISGISKALENALNASENPPGAVVKARRAVIESPVSGNPTASASTATASGGAEKAATGTPSSEDAQARQKEPKNEVQTLRIGVDKIDHVMNLTGEVVLIRNRLLNLAGSLEHRYSSDQQMESLLEAVSFLDLLTSDMQLAVMKMRMQPLKKVFGKFPRMVKEISAPLGKDVELRISGEDTEVDKSVIEQIGDPLVHIIRNSIDHAIEPRTERVAMGKPERGIISISASQKGNQIIIEVADDGKGIDVEKVKQKAISKGLISAEDAEAMGREAAVNLIFLPGLSTNEVATELSGRGVGMDVVKNNVSKLNGFIEIVTKKGEGTNIRISLPLTLAIIHALLVEVKGAVYAIPLTLVDETLKVAGTEIQGLLQKKVLNIRGRVYPYFELADLLDGQSAAPGFHPGPHLPFLTAETSAEVGRNTTGRYVIVVAVADSRFCIGVDSLLGLQEVVIKSITGSNNVAPCILGATISGDGKVTLIIDMGYIARSLFEKERVQA